MCVLFLYMTYSFALCGWEGSKHDGGILQGAITKGLPRFRGKYHLGDAGYALSRYCLTPCRGVRYYLKEWGEAKNFSTCCTPLTLKCGGAHFGDKKKRFPILTNMHSYPYRVQCLIVHSAFMIHNFIRVSEEFRKTSSIISTKYRPMKERASSRTESTSLE